MMLKQIIHRGMDLHGVDFNTLLDSKVDVIIDGKNKWIEFDINGFKEVINISNDNGG